MDSTTVQDVATHATRILRVPSVVDRIGLSRSTIWRLVREGKFPAPVQLTPHTVGWREADIETWLRERAARPTMPPASLSWHRAHPRERDR